MGWHVTRALSVADNHDTVPVLGTMHGSTDCRRQIYLRTAPSCYTVLLRRGSAAWSAATARMKKLYVGNLPWRTTDAELEDLFSRHGNVESSVVITDRETGRSRGFGFVEMDDAGADAAIEALNGYDVGGRELRVNEARERERAPRRTGGNRW